MRSNERKGYTVGGTLARLQRALVVLVPLALVPALLAWGAWSVVQARLTVGQNPAARSAAAGCSSVDGWTYIYRITLIGHGAVCSALMHQQSFYSYAISRVVPDHWSRLDCAVAAPRAAAFCSEQVLHGPGDWAGLAGPPAPEVTAMTVMSVP